VRYAPRGAQAGCSSPSLGREPVGGKTAKSATQGQCDARHMVTFPATPSPPLHRYQITVVNDSGACWRTTCPESGTAGTRTRDFLFESRARSPSVTPPAYAQSMLCKLESDRHTVAFRSSSDQTSAERIGGRHSGRLAAKFRFLNFMFPAFI